LHGPSRYKPARSGYETIMGNCNPETRVDRLR